MLAENLVAAEAGHVIDKAKEGGSAPFDAQDFAALGETPQCRQHSRDY